MIGQVVGQYKITEKLGEGGMGAVYKGIDLMVEREVAIKMLRPDIAKQPELVERFRSEAVMLAKLNNPGIATLYNFFRQGDDFFMVMEFVSGQTLESIIRNSGAVPWDRAVPLFNLILDCIVPAHNAGILHRDIKPANIMVTTWGGVKVMDFGIARVLGSARMTREGRMVGTIEYIAPERIKGNEADVRADIYSLGVVLYEMLSGHLPFESQSEFEIMRGHIQDAPPPFGQWVPGIPAALEQVVMRSLAKSPEQRFQSCSEFIVALQTVMQYGTARPRTDPNLVTQSVYDYHNLKPTMMAESGQASSNRPTEVPGSKPTMMGAQPAAAAAGAEPKATRFEPTYQGGSTGQSGVPPYQPPAYPGTGGYAAYPPQQQSQQPYQQGYPNYQQNAPPAVPTPADKPSFLGNLNWKHYAAAGGLAVVLLAVLLFAFRGGKSEVKAQTAKEPATQDTVQKSSEPSAPARPSGPPPVQSDSAGTVQTPTDRPADVRTSDPGLVLNLPDSDDKGKERAAAKAREEAAAKARAAEAERKRKLEDILNGK